METRSSMRRKLVSLLCALALLLALCVPAAFAEAVFSGGSGTADAPYQIATAEQLVAVAENLSACYILTADIDLSGEAWTPIGSFVATAHSVTGEDPDPAYAFTGRFDGNGHAISGLKIDKSFAVAGPYMGTGLFGVVMGTSESSPAEIKNLTLVNVDVRGFCLVGAAVGLQGGNSLVDNVDLIGSANTINGCEGVGGIVGTGADADNYVIKNCDVANVTITVEPVDLSDYGMASYPAACAGGVIGGLTGGEIENCNAENSLIVATGADVYSIGGIVGAPYGTSAISSCDTENVTIQVDGPNPAYIGGIAGSAGTYGEAAPTLIQNCDSVNIHLIFSDSADFVGGVVGGGKEETHNDTSTALGRFLLTECSASGEISGTAAAGAIAGRAEGSKVSNCTADITTGGEKCELQIGVK